MTSTNRNIYQLFFLSLSSCLSLALAHICMVVTPDIRYLQRRRNGFTSFLFILLGVTALLESLANLQCRLISSHPANHFQFNKSSFTSGGNVNGWYPHFHSGVSGLHHRITFTCLTVMLTVFLPSDALLQFILKFFFFEMRCYAMYLYLAWNLPRVDVQEASRDLAMILLLLCDSSVPIISRRPPVLSCLMYAKE